MGVAPKHQVPVPAPARPEQPWQHSGFGSDSALEAMKRVARTKPGPHHHTAPNEARPAPSAADRKAKASRRPRQRER
jgi:hypothetical protein